MNKINKKANIYVIAKQAGVSKSTVSRVLNDKPNVSAETRRKVLRVIEKFNYRPNSSAKSLATSKTKTIGLVVSDITDPFFAEFVKGAEAKVIEEDYNMMLSNTHWVVEEELKYMRMFQEGRVDGILMISGPNGKSDDYLNSLATKETPIVLIDRKVKNKDIPKINVNNFNAAYKGTKYLLELGHKKVAFVKGTDIAASNASEDRTEGYKKALSDFGIEDELIFSGNFDRETAYQITFQILKQYQDVTAVFYASDVMAVGGIKAIKELELRIPQDVSIIGCDDLELASLVDPPLTTLKQPRYKMGYLGMERLINKLEGREDKFNNDMVFEMELIKRASTAPIIK